ncbi:MAG: hypothetical protein WCP60_10175 [bacterium]
MKRLLKWISLIVGVLIVLIFLFVATLIAWLKWSGEQEWKQAQAELRAKGEKLTYAELVPPPPPDGDNFFADPLWAEYADLVCKKNEHGMESWELRLPSEKRQMEQWQFAPLDPVEMDRFHALMPTEKLPEDRINAFGSIRMQLRKEKDPQKQKEEALLLLDILSPAQPILTRIAKLSERPRAQFPIRYDLGAGAPLPQITAILKLSQTLNEKIFSELILGKNSEAAADTMTLLSLGFIQKDDPFLISFLVRASSVTLALQAVNEGIVRHAWTESNLIVFQDKLERMHLREDFLFALKGERAFFNQFDPAVMKDAISGCATPSTFLEKVQIKVYPLLLDGIFLKDMAYHNLWIQRNVEALNSDFPEGWNVATVQPLDLEFKELANNPVKRVIYTLNLTSIPAVSISIKKAAEIQTQVIQALIACALERYRLAHGSYPASLDALVPEYLSKLPKSPINGKPMNYSLQPDGTFSLWSVGWNLKTLNGKPGELKGDGDIVWNQPLTFKISGCPQSSRHTEQKSQTP